MKKLILIVFFTLFVQAQDSFSVKYDYVVKDDDGIKTENPVNVVVIYNYLNTGDIMFINSSGEKTRYYITKINKEAINSSGERYVLFDAIDSVISVECFIQVFKPDLVFRIIYKNPVISLTFHPE